VGGRTHDAGHGRPGPHPGTGGRGGDLRAYARQLGLDAGPFYKELVEHTHAARVDEDFMSGVRSGVNGTPTFFINAARHDGSYELQALLAALERAAAS
jgi:protein-disulfide isomerase